MTPNMFGLLVKKVESLSSRLKVHGQHVLLLSRQLTNNIKRMPQYMTLSGDNMLKNNGGHLGCVAPTSFNFKPGSDLNLNTSIDLHSILNCQLTTDQILILVQLAVMHAH